MYLILLLASMTALAAPQPDAGATEQARPTPADDRKQMCRNDRVRQTDDFAGQAPRARRLDELPTGNLELAVMREVDGCIEPTIVRQGYGAVAAPERR